MATFSLSNKSLGLTPPQITGGPPSNYATAGNAVNLARIFQANRASSPDVSAQIAQNTAARAAEQAAVMQAEADARIGAINSLSNIQSAKAYAAAQKSRGGASASSGGGIGSKIGGTLGSLVGSSFGPVGSIVGGGLGSIVGGLFG
tara:strand:+ start:103 stop:540 length:438 start_codon:yes stop_codon:yes gene_type:complete